MSRRNPNQSALLWLLAGGGALAFLLLMGAGVGVVVWLANRTAPNAPTAEAGVIAFQGLPADAVVTVDGARVAVTWGPDGDGSAEVSVPPGEHAVEVRGREAGWGVEEVAQPTLIDPAPAQPTPVELDPNTFRRTLAVDSGERRRLLFGRYAAEPLTTVDVTEPFKDDPIIRDVTIPDPPIRVTPVVVEPDDLRPLDPVPPGPVGPFGPLDGGGPGDVSGGTIPENKLFGGRSGATRSQLVRGGGASAESEAAVAKGLAWLARQQKKDGTWAFDSGGDKAAATGLGLLPFLAAGQTHKGTAKDNKYKETVTAALKALLDIQKKNDNGRFSDDATANAIATLAVCEAFGLTGDRTQLQKPCQSAVEAIQKAQGANGSWGDRAGDDGDTCIAGWQIQALHSAKMCKDLKVDTKVLERAAKFLDGVAGGSSKFKYGYSDAASARPTPTAAGLLCRYHLSGWGPNSAGMKDGAAYLLKEHPPEKEQEFDLGYYFHATQVLHFAEGDSWSKNWNPKMRDLLVGKQIKDDKQPSADGSWDKDSAWIGDKYGRLGTTAMALLTLEVYYRHLPIYKRGNGGLAELDGR